MLKSKTTWTFIDEQHKESEQEDDVTIINTLLRQRGVLTAGEQQKFLNPALEDLQSPHKLNMINDAYHRIMKAIEQGELIVVYGDYDADGITATALLIKVLTQLGAHCDYYIPNRFEEGYGLNKAALEHLYNQGAELVITVDTGITSVNETAYANELGLDIIITDHHEAQPELPEAKAIIHPHLSPDYNFKLLAGVGVAFQLAQTLLNELPHDLLDLVAIGTIADLVPLHGENRILTYYGLQQIQNSSNLGLNLLIEHCRIQGPVDEEHVGFIIAPRLNAVGRLANARLAVELLVTDDVERVKTIISEIEQLNSERQQIVRKMIQEAEVKIKTDSLQDDVIMLYDEEWHEGVLGIAASRIAQKYNRPTFMFTYHKERNELKGSARSIKAFDLFDHCMSFIHLFDNFGGHAQAAGMTLPFEHLAELNRQLNERFHTLKKVGSVEQEININKTITLSDMTEQLIKEVQALAPFGMENEKPVFHLKETPIQMRRMGQNEQHLKIQFKDGNRMVDGIGFNKGHIQTFISPYTSVALVGALQLNEWNGIRTVQILIEDIAIDDVQLFDYRGKIDQLDFAVIDEEYDKQLMIAEDINHVTHNTPIMTYDEANHTNEVVDVLYLTYLPQSLNQLEDVIDRTQPRCLFLCYDMPIDQFFEQIPSRDEFKALYIYLKQTEPKEVKEKIIDIMRVHHWNKRKVIFMMHVFVDLHIVKLEDRIVHVNEQAGKNNLETSKTYQQFLQQKEMKQLFYYSTYQQLKEWFTKHRMTKKVGREEVSHGL